MRAGQAERQLVAVVASYGRNRCDYGRLRVRASEVGLQEDGAFVVRLDRVVIEMLLREHLSSAAAREGVIPSLLAQRVLLSWWRPIESATAARDSWADVAADPEVLYAVLVPLVVKTWVMEALTGWEL